MTEGLKKALAAAGADVRTETRPGDIGEIIRLHGLLHSSEHGYDSVVLWTEGSLETATTLYRRAGFALTDQKRSEVWGAVRTEERYDLKLG